MKKLILIALLAFAGASSVAAQNLPSINIVNRTGYTIYLIYMSPSENDEWGDDLLGEDILENGESFTCRLLQPLSQVKVYDIAVKDEDGDTYIKWEVTLTNNARIEFTIDDLDMEPGEE